nr:pilus assembly protein [Geotalea sp. SG265]
MVELAFSLFLLMLIFFGITEFGRAMYLTNALNNAAREGARRAVVSNLSDGKLNEPQLQEQVKGYIPFDTTGIDVSIEPKTPVSSGTPVSVTVTLPFQPIARPLFNALSPDIFPEDFKLTGHASMRYE